MSEPDERRGAASLWLKLAASLGIAALFGLALAPYLDAIPRDLSIDPGALAGFFALLVAYLLARGSRWLFLLRPIAKVPIGRAIAIGLAGSMWIALLPFRLGELARPLLLSRTTAIGLRQGLGVIALERVVDGLMICALFFATIGDRPAAALTTLHAATIGVMAVFFAALVVLLVMARWPRVAGRILRATIGRVLPRAASWAADLSHGIAEGMAALPRGGPLALFVLASVVYWTINALAMWVLARGCDLPLSFAQIVTVMAVMNIALLVPGGPAQLGTFQGGVALGLSLFFAPAVVQDRGSTFVFWLYLGQLVAIAVAGGIAQRRLPVDWRSIVTPASPDPPEAA